MENQEKVLALIGYTRKNGNTQALLEDYLKEFAQDKEVDLVDLNALDFKGCIHCDGCLKEPFCRLRDDFSPIYQKIEEANHLVFASPVYFNGVTWLLKKAIDRMQVYFSNPRDWQGKKSACLLLTAGAKPYPDQFTASYLEGQITLKTLGYKPFTCIQVGDTDRRPYEAGFLRKEAIKINGINRRKGNQWELIE